MSAKKTLNREQRHALLATPAGWLACGFGSGLAPVAQGTFGSLAALLPWLLLRELSLPLYVVVLLVGFGVGVWACNLAGRALGVDDHRTLVWDEFIGQWIARDADNKGFNRLVQLPFLFLTLMAGPIGLLLWLVVRERRARAQAA